MIQLGIYKYNLRLTSILSQLIRTIIVLLPTVGNNVAAYEGKLLHNCEVNTLYNILYLAVFARLFVVDLSPTQYSV